MGHSYEDLQMGGQGVECLIPDLRITQASSYEW